MILIVGGSGTLGKYLQNSLRKSNIPFLCPSSSEFDISSDKSVADFFKQSQKFDMIYHLAAITDVDLCERTPSIAYETNVLGTERIARYASKSEVPITFISSSAVFGGGVEKWRYCELDIPIPINLYGNSKLYGENTIKAFCQDYLIVRSSWMIGGGPERDKKFVSKIISELMNGNEINVVHDKIGSLTYAKDLADFIVLAYNKNYRGVVHFSSNNYASRYDIAKYMASILNSKSKITGIDSNSFPLSAPRAVSEALYSVTDYVVRKEWQDIIQDYLKEEWA